MRLPLEAVPQFAVVKAFAAPGNTTPDEFLRTARLNDFIQRFRETDNLRRKAIIEIDAFLAPLVSKPEHPLRAVEYAAVVRSRQSRHAAIFQSGLNLL